MHGLHSRFSRRRMGAMFNPSFQKHQYFVKFAGIRVFFFMNPYDILLILERNYRQIVKITAILIEMH